MRILEEALTFDDVLLVPAYSEVLPRDVSLASQLTREIRVNLPVVSAAMDTVTEARLAITIAQEGGIGIIHKNMSIDNQARQVDRVKKFESGVISDPITVNPDMTIRQVLELTRAKNISAVFEVERHLRQTKLRERSHFLHPGKSGHFDFDPACHQFFRFLSRQRRHLGVDLDLDACDVRHCINRQVHGRPQSRPQQSRRREKDKCTLPQ